MASFLQPLLLCILILSPICVLAQTKSNIAVGDSFQAENSNPSWVVSPSGDYAFGFLPLENNKNLFLLSIWYAKIPDKTIVWSANGDSPAPKGSKAQLSADNGLVLTAPNGNQLWRTEFLTGNVARGVLNDTGNFVLEDVTFDSVWETFKNPRDTLLPSQILEQGGKLSSRLMETDFSKGRFKLFLQQDGNLVMYSINLPSEYANENYYESGTVESKASSSGIRLVFDRTGEMYILRKNNDKYSLSEGTSVSATQYYLRATLNFDGVFTLFQYPKSSSSGSEVWSPVWSQPDNICTSSLVSAGSGVCGYNSICTLKDDNSKRPICQCPERYSLLDPNDPYGSCKPDFIQGCAEDELSKRKDLYEFEVLIDTDWPLSDYVLQKPFTEEKCRQSCLEDCLCAVAIFRLGDSCWKKKLPLSNGRVDAALNGAKAFIKVRKDNSSLCLV